MPNIALLTRDNASGGAAIAVSRLAKGLTSISQNKSKFSFTLLASILKEKNFSVTKKQIGGSTNRVNSIAREFLDKAITQTWSYTHRTRKSPRAFFMQGLRDVRADLQGFDIVNMFWMQTLADLSKLAKIRNPKVITLHDMWFLTGGCSYSFGCDKFRSGCNDCDFMWAPLTGDACKQYLAKGRILFDGATRVVVTSKWMHDAAIGRGIEDSKITTIKNYIPENYHFFDNIPLAKKLLGIDDSMHSKIIFYFVGSIGDPRKGFDLFCNAVIRLPHHYRKEILVMHLGPVDKSKDILLYNAGICIIHLGIFGDEVPQVIAYNAADYLICPSRYDNTPNVIAEAHMCGLPVIAANTTGTSEMVSEGNNGMLTNVENADEFACALSNAIVRVNSFSKATICDNANTVYGLHATCHNYLKLYSSML